MNQVMPHNFFQVAKISDWHIIRFSALAGKEHWNTVYVSGDVSEKEIHEMITHSYDLTKPKIKKRLQHKTQ